MSEKLAYAYESGYQDGLRCAEAENAELRDQIHWLKHGDILHVLTDQELADQQKHELEVQASITALDDENAKLRELFAAILKCSGEIDRDNGCETCPMYDSDGNVRDRTWCVWRQAARDAGFDVPIQSLERTNEEVERLRVENAKLRELCASLYEFAMSEYPDGTELNFAERMRELGIEVE